MIINGLADTNINIESIGKVGKQNASETNTDTGISFDAGVMTMASTDVQKNGIIGGLCEDGSLESVKEMAEVLKDNIGTLTDKMDTGSVVKMDEDGIDINNTDTDKIVTVVEEIQIKLAMYCDDFSLAGTNVDMDDIKQTMGSAVSGYKAAASMNNCEKAYLVKNQMEPSIENVYKAMHAGVVETKGSGISDEDWNELVPQVSKIIESAGLSVNDTTLDESRYLIDNDIELNEKNIAYFNVLGEIEPVSDEAAVDRISATLLEGREASATKVTGESLPWEETMMAISVLNSATEENIMELSGKDSQTLDVLSDIEMEDGGKNPDYSDKKFISTYRKLQEIRLMMTLDAGRFLENNNISINTTELSDLVDRLKEYEVQSLSAEVNESENKVDAAEVTEVNDVMLAMENLRKAPAAILGQNLGEDEVTIGKLSSTAYTKATAEYEALSTEIRTDLGDSVYKAVVASTEGLLSDMGYEDNEENRRAVRILAYNDLEINEQNIDKIKALDSSVNTLFKKMTPEKTLKMIRENVNPMDKDVRDLADYFSEMPEEQSVEKYSEFLYKLENSGDISEEEREKYMGVYSLVAKFEKDGMNVLGSVLEQGLPLTMGNLLTAYMTRMDKGIDLKADDTTGLSEISDKVTYYKNLFSGSKEKIMPEVLSDIDNIDEMTPEEFVKNVTESENYEADARTMDNLEELANISDDILEMVTEYEIPATINNLLSAKKLVKNQNEFFEGTDTEVFAEAIGNRDELEQKYEDLSESAKSDLQKAMEEMDGKLDINSLKQISIGMNLLKGLANKNNFYIPINEEGRKLVINLKIVQEGDETGKVQISYNSEKYGKVSVEGKISENSTYIQAVSDSDSGVEHLSSKQEEIENKLQENNFENVRVNINKSDEMPILHSNNKSEVKTDRLFLAAKIFVESIAN